MSILPKPLRSGGRKVANLVLGQRRYSNIRSEVTRRDELQRLYEMRAEYVVPVKEPLLLISQIQRSGGTLLSQLFDNHPQVHSHPGELYVGYPDKSTWPLLDMNATPEVWYEVVSERPVYRFFRNGYSKYSLSNEEKGESYPFVFPPSLQKYIFDQIVAKGGVKTQRDVFDAYFTSYFNAWLDNQNLYSTPKRAITGFVPRMGMNEQNVARFFAVYPEGRYVGVIRDPKSWFVSARKHDPQEYGSLEKAIKLWSESSRMMLAAKAAHKDNVRLLSYEELIGDTEGTMRALCAFMGIDFSDELLTPTFNGFPIKADSSYKVPTYGVIKEGTTRYKEMLSAADIGYIDTQTQELYQQVVASK